MRTMADKLHERMTDHANVHKGAGFTLRVVYHDDAVVNFALVEVFRDGMLCEPIGEEPRQIIIPFTALAGVQILEDGE